MRNFKIKELQGHKVVLERWHLCCDSTLKPTFEIYAEEARK